MRAICLIYFTIVVGVLALTHRASAADPYTMLGVSRSASMPTIKAARNAMLKKYHSDVNRSAGAGEIAALMNAAFDEIVKERGGRRSRTNNYESPQSEAERPQPARPRAHYSDSELLSARFTITDETFLDVERAYRNALRTSRGFPETVSLMESIAHRTFAGSLSMKEMIILLTRKLEPALAQAFMRERSRETVYELKKMYDSRLVSGELIVAVVRSEIARSTNMSELLSAISPTPRLASDLAWAHLVTQLVVSRAFDLRKLSPTYFEFLQYKEILRQALKTESVYGNTYERSGYIDWNKTARKERLAEIEMSISASYADKLRAQIALRTRSFTKTQKPVARTCRQLF